MYFFFLDFFFLRFLVLSLWDWRIDELIKTLARVSGKKKGSVRKKSIFMDKVYNNFCLLLLYSFTNNCFERLMIKVNHIGRKLWVSASVTSYFVWAYNSWQQERKTHTPSNDFSNDEWILKTIRYRIFLFSVINAHNYEYLTEMGIFQFLVFQRLREVAHFSILFFTFSIKFGEFPQSSSITDNLDLIFNIKIVFFVKSQKNRVLKSITLLI